MYRIKNWLLNFLFTRYKFWVGRDLRDHISNPLGKVRSKGRWCNLPKATGNEMAVWTGRLVIFPKHKASQARSPHPEPFHSITDTYCVPGQGCDMQWHKFTKTILSNPLGFVIRVLPWARHHKSLSARVLNSAFNKFLITQSAKCSEILVFAWNHQPILHTLTDIYERCKSCSCLSQLLVWQPPHSFISMASRAVLCGVAWGKAMHV